MKTIPNLLSFVALLATVQIAPAAVPSTINYQGRLTNALGVVQTGTKSMSVRIYDAATAGTQLYAETIGDVTLDTNGVYGFQFGAAGTSDTLVTETLATTDGSTLSYQKVLSNTPVLPGTVSVRDGTYSWNEITGNPGSPASATANVVSGFVVGATVANGGSGYSAAPAVTITGNGSGAAATATVSSGAVSGITITNAGSNYTTGATISIAPPPAPFVINYSGGTITATYASPPAAGRTITVTYRYSANGISGALAANTEQWLELSVDGVAQSPRQKVLAVPFAMNSTTADVANSLSSQATVWRPEMFVTVSGSWQNTSVAPVATTLPFSPGFYGGWKIKSGIPYSLKEIDSIGLSYYINQNLSGSIGSSVRIKIIRSKIGLAEETVFNFLRQGNGSNFPGNTSEVIPVKISLDQTFSNSVLIEIQNDRDSIGVTDVTLKGVEKIGTP